MKEVKESDKLADTLVVRDTFEISAKSVAEFDSLMIEIQKKQEQYSLRTLDITCEWETMDTHLMIDGTDKRAIKAKKLSPNDWTPFVNRIRKAEEEILTYLNAGKEEDQEKTIPIFSCNVKLRIEKKDKEAQKALEDPRQLLLFSPVDPVVLAYREINRFMAEHNPDEDDTVIEQTDELLEKIIQNTDKETGEVKNLKQFIKDNAKLLDRIRPDGENISKVTFTHIREDGSKGDEVELNAK